MNALSKIRKLDENTANQIAAGEVIERPAAVVKELVENALDARARHIRILVRDGGKTSIEVTDDGDGIAAEELHLAVERHATSKLDDLFAISSFGFRGEALPSIGAVSRLEITSKRQGENAAKISVSGGKLTPVAPASRKQGTSVSVKDLFFATPARLKFLSSDRSELMAIGDVVKRLAIANCEVGFELIDLNDQKARHILALEPQPLESRLRAVLGKALLDDALNFRAEHNGIKLHGYLGLPTAAKGSASAQYFFVNERPVRDKLFFGAVKGAYSDLLPSGKFPFVVLFMDIDAQKIDVNVHPAKSEIRFHEAASVRSFVLNAIRHRLAEDGVRANQILSENFARGFSAPSQSSNFQGGFTTSPRPTQAAIQAGLNAQAPLQGFGFSEAQRAFAPQSTEVEDADLSYPLGVARAQYHDNYIIAETRDGLIIVDQHAAHERLVYEKLKADYAQKRITSQRLLVPEIVSLGAIEREKLLSEAATLAEIGLEIEPFGDDAIAVQSVPATLISASPKNIITSIIDAIDDDPKAALSKRVDEVLASVACHGSVRSGRKLRPEEMNALLREMETTPNSGTCNHGRPTFIKLDLKFLEARFGR